MSETNDFINWLIEHQEEYGIEFIDVSKDSVEKEKMMKRFNNLLEKLSEELSLIHSMNGYLE